MPTYEYKCQQCEFVFESFQQIGDDPLTVCPECSGKLKRVIYGGSGIHFKGSGFYLTDYAKKNASPSVNSKKIK